MTHDRQRRLAVVCSDGCGFKGRRLYPADPKPCPKCGCPVDVGIPYKAARQNANGSLGGHIELSWTRWE